MKKRHAVKRIRPKKGKIQEALALLNDAAFEKSHEISELLGTRYGRLKRMFGDKVANGRKTVDGAKNRIAKEWHREERKLKHAALSLNRKAHKDPWSFLGGFAMGSLLVGFILGKNK